MKTIKDVIRISGLSRRTLQYYDDQGLLKPKRTKENYRLYSEDDLQRLWKILIYKEMDFRLDEIETLLNEEEQAVGMLLQEKVMYIELRIEELKRIQSFLRKIICEGIPNQTFEGQDAEEITYKKMAEKLLGNI